jgi:hypothetical protein
MNQLPQNDNPSFLRWLHRHIFRGFVWVFLAGILTALYFLFHGMHR